MNQIDRTKELETKSIRRLLWMYALPSIVSQIIASVYNIVDRMFLGQCVGALAIAGLAIAFIAAVSVLYQSVKTARTNPAEALKKE